MTNWRYTCNIKQHLKHYDNPDDYYDDAKFIPIRDAVADELKAAEDYEYGLPEFVILVNELAGAQDVDEFNYVLNRLYDVADDHRIWLGL